MKLSRLGDKATLPESSARGPAVASHGGHLFIAWKGSGNDNLNVGVLSGDLKSLVDKHISSETSSHAPALASSGDELLIAWKGSGNDNLNGAKVEWGLADSAGRVSIDGLGVKSTSPETSEAGPALASDGSLGWRGSGNDALNVGEGVWNVETTTLSESSDVAPALTWLSPGIYLAWKGAGNDNLNAMAVAGGAKLLNQTAAVTFGASSSHSPALAAHTPAASIWPGRARVTRS